MRRLILMRHGKAERAQAGEEDVDRSLTERGRTDAALIAGALAGQGLTPDRVLVSRSRRTRETWAAMTQVFPSLDAEVDAGLYLASPGEVMAAAEDAREADTVMVVGHNPGLHQLALDLLEEASASPSTGARLRDGFPTSSAVVFTFDAGGRPAYDGLFLARDLGGGGGD